MKLNFKKIASVLTGAIMLSSTMGFAAAASYPQPFVSNDGASDAAVIFTSATHAGAVSDITAAIDLTARLNTLVTTGGGGGGSTATGGDSYKFEKTSTKFHLGDTITAVDSSVVDDRDLPTLLADGTYMDDDNDEFDYKQKISMAALQLLMFDEDDYKIDSPTIGFKISDADEVLNYTLDFSDKPLWTDLDATDLPIMGKEYYVLSHATDNNSLILLDSATSTTLNEGETTTIDGKTVSINFISTNDVKLNVDGEITNSLNELDTYKLEDGSYIGIKDISVQDYADGVKQVEFSLGNGKLVLTDGDEVEMNEDDIDNLIAHIANGTNLDTIILQWKMDGDSFVTEDSSITMPGFETISLAFGGLNYPAEEEIIVQANGDDNLVLSNFPLEETTETLNLLYSDGTNFTLIGKDSNNLLATAQQSENLTFTEGTHDYFVVSYKSGDDAESYLVKAKNFDDSDYVSEYNGNEVDFEYLIDGSWTSLEVNTIYDDTISVGSLAEFTIEHISNESSKTVTLSVTGNNYFNMLYSAEGMEVYLPWMDTTAVISNSTTANYTTTALACAGEYSIATGQLGYNAVLNFTAAGAYGESTNQTTCTSTPATYNLVFTEEDENDAIASGDLVTVAVGLDSDSEVYVTGVTTTDDNLDAEIGESDVYREFLYSDLATEILNDQSGDGEKVTLIYHGAEVAADVYITSHDTVITPGTTTPNNGGLILAVDDSKISSVSDKNLIVVGGSCVNEVAAKLLGSDVPVCGADFTAATSVISGGYIIKVFDSPYNAEKIAMLVAGYEASDTVNAIAKLRENTVSTVVGTEVIYPTTNA